MEATIHCQAAAGPKGSAPARIETPTRLDDADGPGGPQIVVGASSTTGLITTAKLRMPACCESTLTTAYASTSEVGSGLSTSTTSWAMPTKKSTLSPMPAADACTRNQAPRWGVPGSWQTSGTSWRWFADFCEPLPRA